MSDPVLLDLRALEKPVNPFKEHLEMLLNEDAANISDEELSRLKLVVARLQTLSEVSKFETTDTALMVMLARLAVSDLMPGDSEKGTAMIDSVIRELVLIKKTMGPTRTVRDALSSTSEPKKKTVRDLVDPAPAEAPAEAPAKA